MSCFGSTKTDFSASNMSLASSTLMTALSTCTMSDADYETSDEQLLSPQIRDEVEPQPSQSSSNLRWSASLLASQSVSCLADASEDFASTSDAADKYAMTVKSDTCLNQQSKIISDFIDDMRLQQQDEGEEGLALSGRDSATSVQTEFYPATNASDDSPYGSIVDVSLADPADVAVATPDREVTDHDEEECAAEKAHRSVRLTLSETRHRIIENLAQVTSDKLFSKPAVGLRYFDCESIGKADQQSQADLARRVASSQRRPFQRCRGVESLLQIDYELQPLNLMLSRLLAEFRAMDLRGKLGHVEPVESSSCSKLLATRAFADAHPRRKEEHQPADSTCAKFSSHERLAAARQAAVASIAQISRSCEDNCLASRLARGASCCSSPRRTEPSEKHPECSNETERNPRCHRGETRCTAADDRRSQKPIDCGCEEEDFASGSAAVIRLMEIASTN